MLDSGMDNSYFKRITTYIKAKLYNPTVRQKNLNIFGISNSRNSIYYFRCKILYVVAKLIKYIMLYNEISTPIGYDYKDASLLSLYLVVIGIAIYLFLYFLDFV